jgi:uncharacterized membrane protein YkoI
MSRRPILALLATGLVAAAPAAASDPERARAAVESGRILPLSRILEQIEAEWRGTVIEAKLDRKGGGHVYEMRLLTAEGRVIRLRLDAETGAFLEAEGRGIERLRRP